MDEYYLDEEDIINKNYYEQIKEMIKCIICFNIIEDPVQCSICKYHFCKECIIKLARCPMGCQNYEIIPGTSCNELLSGIKIKCNKCGEEVNYDNIKKHKEEDCQKIDFKERYFQLKAQYELMLNNQNNQNNGEYETPGSITTSVHNHPVHIMRHFKCPWTCDICDKTYNQDIPTYNCSLCDFDICYNCAQDKIIKGEIDINMKDYYYI